MTVRPLAPADVPDIGAVPDAPPAGLVPDAPVTGPGPKSFAQALASAFDAAGGALARADAAERAFAAHRGGLQEMVLQRAQADVALSLAATAASRVSQALTTVLGMQV